MAIMDLALHPFAYVTIAELSDYWRVSRIRVLEHIAAGRFEAIEFAPGIYRVRASTALAFERQIAVTRPIPTSSVVAWPADRARALTGGTAPGSAAESSTGADLVQDTLVIDPAPDGEVDNAPSEGSDDAPAGADAESTLTDATDEAAEHSTSSSNDTARCGTTATGRRKSHNTQSSTTRRWNGAPVASSPTSPDHERVR